MSLNVEADVSLQPFNTFGVATRARYLAQAHDDAEVAEALQAAKRLQLPLLVTHLQGTQLLHEARLPRPCAWVMGHEGQGVRQALVDRASLLLRIAQPGGEESLNVASAAAICLYASSIAR